MKPSKPPKPAPKSSTLLALALALSLPGCATRSPEPVIVSAPLPKPPSVSTQQPPQAYSDRAKTNIEQWLKKLTDTRLMSEP